MRHASCVMRVYGAPCTRASSRVCRSACDAAPPDWTRAASPPQGLLLSLLPLVADASSAVCAGTLRTLHSLVHTPAAAAAAAERAVFSDTQAALLLGLVGQRAEAGGLDGELLAALAATARLVLTHCHLASSTLLKVVPLAFHLHAVALRAHAGEGGPRL
jgi:alkylhydroperoxidase family enzyme